MDLKLIALLGSIAFNLLLLIYFFKFKKKMKRIKLEAENIESGLEALRGKITDLKD